MAAVSLRATQPSHSVYQIFLHVAIEKEGCTFEGPDLDGAPKIDFFFAWVSIHRPPASFQWMFCNFLV